MSEIMLITTLLRLDFQLSIRLMIIIDISLEPENKPYYAFCLISEFHVRCELCYCCIVVVNTNRFYRDLS